MLWLNTISTVKFSISHNSGFIENLFPRCPSNQDSEKVLAAAQPDLEAECQEVDDHAFKRFVSMPILKLELPSSLKMLKHINKLQELAAP